MYLIIVPLSLLKSLLVFCSLDTFEDEVYVSCRKTLSLGLSDVFF